MHAIRLERLTLTLRAEIDALVTDYYATTQAHRGIPPYDFLWDNYAAFDEAGVLATFTCREDTALLGVGLYLIAEAPHHRGLIVAECDSLSVSRSARGRGIGKALVDHAAAHFRSIGVHRLIHRHRLVYGERSIFPGLGFEATETVYTKEL